MKKITIVNSNLNYGGIEQYLSSLCDMINDDYDIELYIIYKCNDIQPFKFDNVKIKYLYNYVAYPYKLKNYLKYFKLIKAFKEIINAIKILISYNKKMIKLAKSIKSDYIITTRLKETFYINKYSDNNIIKIYTEHSFPDNNYIEKIKEYTINYNMVIPVSENITNIYKSHIDNNKLLTITNVLDNVSNEKSSLNNNNIISIGRFDKVKGYEDLIKIVSLIKNKINNIKLYLIGDGEEKNNIENKIKELGLENNVILTGFLNKEEITKYMLDSSLYVMTSYSESFGLVLIESMSYGVPCIAFSNNGSDSILNNGCGIIVKDRDNNIMTNKIIDLLNNKEELKEYSKKGLISINKYNKDIIKKEWLKILK